MQSSQENFLETNTEIKKILEIQKAYTHSGTFHADDILSAALLKIINPKIEILRINDESEYEGKFMFDIGNGRYDHHDGTKLRDDGTPYAAFGLLMKDVYPLFMDFKHYQLFDNSFIREIDLCDNTANRNPLSMALSLFNPIWNSEESEDKAFSDIVDFMIPFLKNMLKHAGESTFIYRYWKYWDQSIDEILLKSDFMSDELYKFIKSQSATYGKYKSSPLHMMLGCNPRKLGYEFLEKMIIEKEKRIVAAPEAYDECMASYKGGDVLILDKYIPYDKFTADFPIDFVIFPSNRKGYNICATQKLEGKVKTYKKLFPKNLRGQSEEFLRSKIKGLKFVHKTGFMATTDTLEEAMEFTAMVT